MSTRTHGAADQPVGPFSRRQFQAERKIAQRDHFVCGEISRSGFSGTATPAHSNSLLSPFAGKIEIRQSRPVARNIIQNAVNSSDHTTLVAAVKAAGLVETLEGKGPFTVFAPTNEAFDKLPAGTVDTLVKPENKGKLTAILTYHVVPGKISAGALAADIKKGGGQATLKTVNGETLTASKEGDTISLTDASGNTAKVTIADVNQSNGVIHVIDTVLLPK
jgi:uncharacterized surface protein with fasciclin (FAS1) repeats